jgi:hypothetical protein
VVVLGGWLVSGGAARAATFFWTGTYSELNQFSSPPPSYPGITDKVAGSSSLTIDYASSGIATVKQSIDVHQVETQKLSDGSVVIETTAITGSSQTQWPVADAYPLGVGPGVAFVRGTGEWIDGTCRLAQRWSTTPSARRR